MTFIHVLNLSIRASWLVLAVVILRFLLKKAPKAFHCALWALVAVRLLCPVSLESSLSLVPSREVIPEHYLQMEAPKQNLPVRLEIISNPVYDAPATVDTGRTASQVQNLDLIATVVWLAGMGAMAIYALYSYLAIRLRVRMAGWIRGNIWSCDDLDSPFILGLFRPRIYLPSHLDETTCAHVLSHEKAHLKRLDHLWKPLGYVLLTVHWFNPLMWAAYILLCRDIELACDERVIRTLDRPAVRAYSEALVSCAVNRRMLAVCPLAFGEVGVKGRIRSMLRYKKPGFWLMAAAVTALFAAAVCFLTDPADISPKLEQILEQDGFTITSSAEESLTLTLDRSLLPENVLNGKRHEFEPGLLLWEDGSTAIVLDAARMSGDELLLECAFTHTVGDCGALLLPWDPLDDSVGRDIHVLRPETAVIRGKGRTSFDLCIKMHAYQQADGPIRFLLGGIYHVTYAETELPVAALLDRQLYLAEVLYSDRDKGFVYTPENAPVYMVAADPDGTAVLMEQHNGVLSKQIRTLGALCPPAVTAGDLRPNVHGERDLYTLLCTDGMTAWSAADEESAYQYLLLMQPDGRIHLAIFQERELLNLYRLSAGVPEMEPVVLAGVYTLDTDIRAPYFLLDEEGSFTMNFNPTRHQLLQGSYTLSGTQLTLNTADGQSWQFLVNESDRLIFDARHSDPFPVEQETQTYYLTDGGAFYASYPSESGLRLDGLAPGETRYSEQTVVLTEPGSISYEVGYLSPMAELRVGLEDSKGNRIFQSVTGGTRFDTIAELPAETYRVYVTNTGTSGGLEPLTVDWGCVSFRYAGILQRSIYIANQDYDDLYETALDKAITQAIHSRCRTEQADSRICTCVFRIMDKQELCAVGTVDGDPGTLLITVYLRLCYHEYSMDSGTLRREAEVFTPAVAVFDVRNGDYILTEYFTPDPETYETDLAARFTQKALDHLKWVHSEESYMPQQCLEQAQLRLEAGDLEPPEQITTIRHYAPANGGTPQEPSFTLCSDGTFIFLEHFYDSHLLNGSYSLDYHELVMKTSDGQHTWVFDVENGQFCFDAARSSPVDSGTAGPLPDGTAFEMTSRNERLPEDITAALLDTICSSPAQSSSPGAYIEAHPEEYALLLRCSDSTLRYCFARFSEGRQQDLRGHIMAALCRQIIRSAQEDPCDGLYMTGQDWFEAFADQAEELRDDPGNYPCHAFALEVLGR